MKATRAVLLVAGVGFGLWGMWLMRDFSGLQLRSTIIWLVGGVVLHDAVLAPVTVALGFLASRLLPAHLRAAAGVYFLVWATLTVTFFPVLSGQGGKADNDTILDRPYWLCWFVLTAVLAVAAAVTALRRRARTSSTSG